MIQLLICNKYQSALAIRFLSIHFVFHDTRCASIGSLARTVATTVTCERHTVIDIPRGRLPTPSFLIVRSQEGSKKNQVLRGRVVCQRSKTRMPRTKTDDRREHDSGGYLGPLFGCRPDRTVEQRNTGCHSNHLRDDEGFEGRIRQQTRAIHT